MMTSHEGRTCLWRPQARSSIWICELWFLTSFGMKHVVQSMLLKTTHSRKLTFEKNHNIILRSYNEGEDQHVEDLAMITERGLLFSTSTTATSTAKWAATAAKEGDRQQSASGRPLWWWQRARTCWRKKPTVSANWRLIKYNLIHSLPNLLQPAAACHGGNSNTEETIINKIRSSNNCKCK